MSRRIAHTYALRTHGRPGPATAHRSLRVSTSAGITRIDIGSNEIICTLEMTGSLFTHGEELWVFTSTTSDTL